MTVMIRVSTQAREQLMRIAAEDFGGVTADEALRKLVEEHEVRLMIEAVQRYAVEHPEDYEAYLAESDAMDQQWSPALEPWTTEAAA